MKKGTAACAMLLLAAAVVPDTAAAQCAMCRRALASPEGLQLIAALRRGIVVLLATPFILFAVVAFLAVRIHKRRDGERMEGAGPEFVASAMQPRGSGSPISPTFRRARRDTRNPCDLLTDFRHRLKRASRRLAKSHSTHR
jgi:hypothetical protein